MSESVINFYTSRIAEIDNHYNALHSILESTCKSPEGNCLYYHESLQIYPELINKRANLLYLAAGPSVTRIAEIGLNAGHSALLLALPNNARITFFDINTHVYVKPCFHYLQSQFPDRLELIEGSTLQTLPSYSEKHAGTFDIVHVDGGHTYECFTNDFQCALRMAKVRGIIVVDDTNIPYINSGVEKAIADGIVEPVADLLYTIGYQHRAIRRVV